MIWHRRTFHAAVSFPQLMIVLHGNLLLLVLSTSTILCPAVIGTIHLRPFAEGSVQSPTSQVFYELTTDEKTKLPVD